MEIELHATVRVDEDGSYWAEVKELPGCFASGHTLDELNAALIEAVEMCLPYALNDATRRKRRSTPPRLDELKLVAVG